VNLDFPSVIRGCARHGPGEGDGVWITDSMIEAYTELHRLGHAHSVEVWRDGELAGGLYGVAVGGLFAGESMFHRITDASKVALTATVRRLAERGFALFDVQFLTDHTRRMGACEIPRSEYLRRLRVAVQLKVSFV
jgi:leucyl/phenylalanyl-tRNA--protein transferase